MSMYKSAGTIVVLLGIGVGCRDSKPPSPPGFGDSPFGRMSISMMKDLTGNCPVPLQFGRPKFVEAVYLKLSCEVPAPDLAVGKHVGWSVSMTKSLQIFAVTVEDRVESLDSSARAVIAAVIPVALQAAFTQSLDGPDGRIPIELDRSQQIPFRSTIEGYPGLSAARIKWDVSYTFFPS
jgi:hypothetical protein